MHFFKPLYLRINVFVKWMKLTEHVYSYSHQV